MTPQNHEFLLSESSAKAAAVHQQNDETFRHLVDSVKDYAIFLLSPEGRVVSWNQGAHRIKGYKADEIIGKHFSRFYPQEAIESKWPDRELEIAGERGTVYRRRTAGEEGRYDLLAKSDRIHELEHEIQIQMSGIC